MRIYVSHPSSIEYEAELYRPLETISEHEWLFPHRPELQNQHTRALIGTVDLVLAEVSAPSTGQGIELGWANAAGVPIAAIHRQGTKPTRSIRRVTDQILSYFNQDDLIKKVRQKLDEHP